MDYCCWYSRIEEDPGGRRDGHPASENLHARDQDSLILSCTCAWLSKNEWKSHPAPSCTSLLLYPATFCKDRRDSRCSRKTWRKAMAFHAQLHRFWIAVHRWCAAAVARWFDFGAAPRTPNFACKWSEHTWRSLENRRERKGFPSRFWRLWILWSRWSAMHWQRHWEGLPQEINPASSWQRWWRRVLQPHEGKVWTVEILARHHEKKQRRWIHQMGCSKSRVNASCTRRSSWAACLDYSSLDRRGRGA